MTILDLYLTERADELEELTIEVPAGSTSAELLAVDYELETLGRAFYVTAVDDQRQDSVTVRRVTAAALWYKLNDATHVGSLVLTDLTPAGGLEQILSGTGWNVGDRTPATGTHSLEQQDATPLAMLREWAKVCGLFVIFDTLSRTVDLVTSRGIDRGVSFRYGRNIITARRQQFPPEVTVLYPYGAQGLSIAGVNGGLEYLEEFGYYTAQGLTEDEARERFTRVRVWSDDAFLVDADLLAAGQLRLEELAAPLVRYSVDVVDLSTITGAEERVELHDTVHVTDPELGLVDLAEVVTGRTIYPLEPWRNRVELGNVTDVLADGDRSTRSTLSEEWALFVDDLGATLKIRNDATYIAGRIPLRFREGGEAHWHVDLFATGAGAGVLVVEVYDAEAAATVYRTLRIPYTDGELVHGSLQWAEQDRSGAYDSRLRLTTEAAGGADPANGVDVVIAEVRFFVLARGAVQETPTVGTSQLFEYTGAVQQFTVPDDVTEVTVTVEGAAGGVTDTFAATRAKGARVKATIAVTPGEVLDVYVGGMPSGGTSANGGWPNGGDADTVSGGAGAGGGGASWIMSAGSIGSTRIAAGAGGGQGDGFTGWLQQGGDGGLFVGGDGVLGATAGGQFPGGGATQFAGGAGGNGDAAADGSLGQGGDGSNATNSFTFPPGGGGGGYYGGGGGGTDNGSGAGHGGGGGGGAGYLESGAYDIEAEDGAVDGHGSVLFEWTDPTA